MKAMERLSLLVGVFALGIAIWYGLWTNWSEPVGPTGMALASAFGFMLAFYMWRTRTRIDGVPPEDDPLGDIEDINGEYGFFSPHSWTPLWLAGSAALIFLGLAVGWWIIAIGAFFTVPALIAWTYEYWKGPHAL